MSPLSPKLTHHYGRGGAGNVTSKDGVAVEEQNKTPNLKGEKYTTGRGGAGNIVKSNPDNPDEARQAQDVDVPPMLLPEGQNRTGRGGAANVYIPSKEEVEQAKIHNEKIRRGSFKNPEESQKQKLLGKGKEALSSKGPIREPSDQA